ncbi:Stp1/IreP family PP2C-type Ser/Thr phosphatase [Tuberibacillus sp. Marseille-P3662]|uniref:Stp1/IreP family PP2C-type Ser/Thr phosphatase n=1 Tax=Tuberibacillus sp. Marseille-P3662 TaxID=1965358 RepID=UPI000A1CB0B1|nr:Stp1/IreP family PP2C-type Ser/Thr phosphatase [Tuberibacillus sp. Marseille-P3662]
MNNVFRTDCGMYRDHNEDTGGTLTNPQQTLAVVADGMGGHKAGDVASDMAMAFIREQWEQLDAPLEVSRAMQWMEETIKAANRHLYDYAKTNSEYEGMGTTLVAALCSHDFVAVANVGDSRCYLFDTHQGIQQQTEDHSLVNELVKAGQLTKEAAEYHPRKHVLTRALGTDDDIDVDTFTFKWQDGGLVLLCSDGLSNKLTDHQLAQVLQTEGTLEERADRLVEEANQAGGEDNITLAIVEHPKGDAE